MRSGALKSGPKLRQILLEKPLKGVGFVKITPDERDFEQGRIVRPDVLKGVLGLDIEHDFSSHKSEEKITQGVQNPKPETRTLRFCSISCFSASWRFAWNTVQKQTLILLLFPRFPTRVHRGGLRQSPAYRATRHESRIPRDLSPDGSWATSQLHAHMGQGLVRVGSPRVRGDLLSDHKRPARSAPPLGTLDDPACPSKSGPQDPRRTGRSWGRVAVLHGADPDAAIFVTWNPGMAVDKTPMPEAAAPPTTTAGV